MKYCVNDKEVVYVEGLLDLLEAVARYVDLFDEKVADWQMQLFTKGFVVLSKDDTRVVIWDS